MTLGAQIVGIDKAKASGGLMPKVMYVAMTAESMQKPAEITMTSAGR